jgi:hypothetical protein
VKQTHSHQGFVRNGHGPRKGPRDAEDEEDEDREERKTSLAETGGSES